MSVILPNRIVGGIGSGSLNSIARWKSINSLTDSYVFIDDNGQMGFGKVPDNAMIDIECRANDVTGIRIKAAENQIDNLVEIFDNDNNALFVINYKGDFGITVQSPNEPLHVQSDYDGNRAIRMGNESDGTSAVARFIVDVLGGSSFLAAYGSNFTTSGSKRANSASLITNASMANGLSLVARNSTTGHIRFYTGGNADVNERGIILANGNWGIGENDPETKLEMTSLSPFFTFHCNEETDNDEGRKSGLIFKGERSGGEEHTLIKILAYHDGIFDDEKACLAIFGNDGDDGNNPGLKLELDSDGNWKFGDGGVTDYVNISKTGVKLFGTARKWECVDLDPANIGLPSTNPPLRDEYQGFQFDRYDRSIEEQVYYAWHIPTDYAVGTASIRGHFELMVENPPSGTGNEAVVMGYEYKKISPGEVFDFSSGTTSGTILIVIEDGESSREIHQSDTGYCDTTGFAKEDLVLFRFFRDATNPNDTYDNEPVAADNDAWVNFYHLEYLLDGVGGI